MQEYLSCRLNIHFKYNLCESITTGSTLAAWKANTITKSSLTPCKYTPIWHNPDFQLNIKPWGSKKEKLTYTTIIKSKISTANNPFQTSKLTQEIMKIYSLILFAVADYIYAGIIIIIQSESGLWERLQSPMCWPCLWTLKNKSTGCSRTSQIHGSYSPQLTGHIGAVLVAQH